MFIFYYIVCFIVLISSRSSESIGDFCVDTLLQFLCNADGSKHTDKDKEFEPDLIIGNSSSLSRKSNTVTLSANIQTATSRSRFAEEKGDNDEGEGTLYLMGTKSNDKRNDDDADDFPQV